MRQFKFNYNNFLIIFGFFIILIAILNFRNKKSDSINKL